MGLAHTRRHHSELVGHWQRVVGSRGLQSPRLGPMEPITQGCQRADLEPLSGGKGREGEPAGETLASEGFPRFPPFQEEAMGEGTCLSPEQAFLNAASLGPKFRAFQPESWGFSLS